MIKFLELNDYENAVLNKADRFTLWSKNFKKEFKTFEDIQDYKNNGGLDNNKKYLVYAIQNNSQACIATMENK